MAGQTIAFVGLVATTLGIAGHFLAEPLLSLLPTDPETAEAVVPPAVRYMEVFLLGVPALLGFFVFVSLIRGYGDTRTPMRIMAVSVAINVVLDPLLIFGWWVFPPPGIVGAAVVTVAARLVATVLGSTSSFGRKWGRTPRSATCARIWSRCAGSSTSAYRRRSNSRARRSLWP